MSVVLFRRTQGDGGGTVNVSDVVVVDEKG